MELVKEDILLMIKVISNLDVGLKRKKKCQDLRPDDKISIICSPRLGWFWILFCGTLLHKHADIP